VKEAARLLPVGVQLSEENLFSENFNTTRKQNGVGKKRKSSREDVLNILIEQKQTAVFITRKIYRFFVNEQVDDAKLNWLADRFYKDNYNIANLMKDIFSSEWFYDEKNIGARIKSPVELIVGMQRILPYGT
jgi:uncharacterized protein (DUF1800 family)